MEAFAHPLVQSVFLPAAVAAVLLALGRVTPAAGIVIGAACAGVLVCLLATLGAVPWPPRSGLHKLAWLLTVAAMTGPLVAWLGASARAAAGGRAGFAVAALAWLAWPRLATPSFEAWAVFAAAAAAALAVTGRPGGGVSGPAAAVLGVGALCLAGVSVVASSLILAQLCGALAVVCGILLAGSLWRGGDATRGALCLASAWGRVCLVLLAALVPLLTRASGWPLALLLPLLFADRLAPARVPCRWRPVVAAAAALVPGLLMIALSVWLSGSAATADDPAYYQG